MSDCPPCKLCVFCIPDGEGWVCAWTFPPEELLNVETTTGYCKTFEYRSTRCPVAK